MGPEVVSVDNACQSAAGVTAVCERPRRLRLSSSGTSPDRSPETVALACPLISQRFLTRLEIQHVFLRSPENTVKSMSYAIFDRSGDGSGLGGVSKLLPSIPRPSKSLSFSPLLNDAPHRLVAPKTSMIPILLGLSVRVWKHRLERPLASSRVREYGPIPRGETCASPGKLIHCASLCWS